MSDLSWLNPTPHAIAVYASQPLSPVATQHSLPSGRYSLLGPDFHRLDRTSFAWRSRVEDRRGGLGHVATLRFPSSLIKPDVPISGIRLSDQLHRKAHGGGISCTRRSCR